MSASVIFGALIAGLVVWVMVVRQLTAKSWQGGGTVGDVGEIDVTPAKLGLWIFMAVVTSLFALFMTAYSMRQHHGEDWKPLVMPQALWANTVLLVLASVALQSARRAVKRALLATLKFRLAAAGVLSLAFIAGQLVAWQQLMSSGQLLNSPAVAFFYLLTAVHGLHLLGGLWVWGRTMARLAGGTELIAVSPSVELCAVYWHFLLLVWLVVFALLSSN